MKIALLTDVHANLVALERVLADIERWQPDQVIMGGDLVNRGPRPEACLALIQQRQAQQGWINLRGNHEEYIMLHGAPNSPLRGAVADVHGLSLWTYQRLIAEMPVLQAMPLHLDYTGPDGLCARFTHGSMLGLRIGVYPETPDADLPACLGTSDLPLSLFGVGHTHRPLVRSLNGTLIVNAGSAGLPFDGDTRASYARLEFRRGRWQAEIVRVAYDLAAAERDFEHTGFAHGAGPLTQLVRLELRHAESHLYAWSAAYQTAVEQGKIGMQASVERYLNTLGLNK